MDSNLIFTVMLIDDSPYSIMLLAGMLEATYKVIAAESAQGALDMLSSNRRPDLIVLDACMPDMTGHQLCAMLKSREDTRHIPIIFLTSHLDSEKEREGLELGAVDYIYKPPRRSLLLARIRNHLLLKVISDQLRVRGEELKSQVLKKSAEVASVQRALISALTVMAGARDTETGKHIIRTQLYIKCLATNLKNHPKFCTIIDDKYIDDLYQSAPLHDIGKIAIPDSVLLKPGRLTSEEFEVMKRHPELGREAIEKVQSSNAGNFDFLELAKEIAHGHHEKWDGSGYPQGLAGDEIPVSARLMAIVDVYDALTSRRPYKEPTSHFAAVDFISRSRGTHFDPDMVDALNQISFIFEKISFRHMDS